MICLARFMQQILTYVECNDMYTPLKQILINRRLANPSERCQSAYRDILFLSFMYFGRDVMDHGKCTGISQFRSTHQFQIIYP